MYWLGCHTSCLQVDQVIQGALRVGGEELMERLVGDVMAVDGVGEV